MCNIFHTCKFPTFKKTVFIIYIIYFLCLAYYLYMLYRYAVVTLLKLSKMKAFKLLLPNGGMVDQNTLFMFSGVKRKVSNESELCKVMRGIWRTDTNSKSFQDWADELNNDGNFEGAFTKFDALDNLASAFVLNIGSECIDIYNFYLQHLPFKETV